jgi:hypothetical protein
VRADRDDSRREPRTCDGALGSEIAFGGDDDDVAIRNEGLGVSADRTLVVVCLNLVQRDLLAQTHVQDIGVVRVRHVHRAHDDVSRRCPPKNRQVDNARCWRDHQDSANHFTRMGAVIAGVSGSTGNGNRFELPEGNV